MNPLSRLRAWLKPRPKSAEELAAEQEAAQLRSEMTTLRTAQRQDSAENYASQRRR